MGKPVILVTGYPKFSKFNENISEKIIKHMKNKEYQSFELNSLLLSVDEEGSNLVSKKIISGCRYDAIIHLGLSDSRDIISLERFAYNEYKMIGKDNSGRCITSGLIIKEIYPIMKLNLRGKGRDFLSTIGKNINMILPVEANTSSSSDKYTSMWLSPDEWMIFSNNTIDQESNNYEIEDLLFK